MADFGVKHHMLSYRSAKSRLFNVHLTYVISNDSHQNVASKAKIETNIYSDKTSMLSSLTRSGHASSEREALSRCLDGFGRLEDLNCDHCS